MEYEYDDYNYEQGKSRKAGQESETSSYDRRRGLSTPIGLYTPQISVHIIQPQEFKDLVQRLTGAPSDQYREECSSESPRTSTISSQNSDTFAPAGPAAYSNNCYHAAENSYYCENYQQQQQPQQSWGSVPSSCDQYPSSPVSNYQPNYCYGSVANCYESRSPYSMQQSQSSPHSPQPFAVIDLPPLSPSDQIWADGWR